MDFKLNHDYHIHSKLSLCSGDEEQTAENISAYAQRNGFEEICITDHFWDSAVPGASDWYSTQNFEHISKLLPLPQSENTHFYFGCETELDKNMTLGISEKAMDKFDFIIIPTTHLHMMGFTIDPSDTSLPRRAEKYIERLDGVLEMDLPFEKIGIAHLACVLLATNTPREHIDLLNLIDDTTFRQLFSKAAKVGVGIELNIPVTRYSQSELEEVLRPFKIAKACGCKFYMGSDAHHPDGLDKAMNRFSVLAKKLELDDSQRFKPFGK